MSADYQYNRHLERHSENRSSHQPVTGHTIPEPYPLVTAGNSHRHPYEHQHNTIHFHPRPAQHPALHPLSYSQENPKAPVGHIVHQQYHQPAFVTPYSNRNESSSGFVRKDSSDELHPSTALTQSRRTARKIGVRRDGSPEVPAPLQLSYQQQRFVDVETEYCREEYTMDHRPIISHLEGSRTNVLPRHYDPRQAPVHSDQQHQDRRSNVPSSTQPVYPTSRQAMNTSEASSMNQEAGRYPPSMSPTMPMPSSRRQLPKYHMKIRQQPLNARACGFGERDRRVIDPPPILQMFNNEHESAPNSITSRPRYPTSVVHCTLWHATLDEEDIIMADTNERRQQRRLMGTLVSSPFVGLDETNTEGCFFTFPDLSCRTSGHYRLRFVLVVIDLENMGPGNRLPFESVVISDVFRVYAAKDFPGMRPSTALTKKLKDQGCLISVKKGNDKKGETGGQESEDESEDGSVDMDDGASRPTAGGKRKPKKKKQKRM